MPIDCAQGPPRLVTAYIGLGSNVGEPLANCLKALDLIDQREGIRLLRRSSFYRTEPVGLLEQDWFINCVAEINTTLPPVELLNALQDVERSLGRERGVRWAPRTIDLDILFYGQEIVREEGISIPHPELHKRRFVLIPMKEIASYLIHPVFCVSIAGLIERVEDNSRVERTY
ncbi:MAG: 2-amino-4-hydroxy-6-hydroxymethyldihydropteridine diphosphokinase [Smithellaceae bacterium]|nr:2-amino-4-hydroxy-6-hydroxymethyldihydropteridine diphosphokinase [Smithellaceae bacterium]